MTDDYPLDGWPYDPNYWRLINAAVANPRWKPILLWWAGIVRRRSLKRLRRSTPWGRYRTDPDNTPCPNCGAVRSRDDWNCGSCAFWPKATV